MNKIYMSVSSLVLLCGGISQADARCDATILQSVKAIQSESSTMKKGERWTDVTQFWRDSATGKSWFCGHGSYCYPATVIRSGKRVEAIRLSNCRIRNVVSREGSEVLYELRQY